jgi:hypothetical protein
MLMKCTKANSWNELNTFSRQLHDLQIDICGVTETNLKWNNSRSQQAKNILQKHSTISSIHTSSNREECLSSYQPGGTTTAIRNKLVGRITSTIQDPTTLGRWSGYKLTTNFGHQLNIITVYQSTKSEGIHTSYQQQAHYFRNKGTKNPDLRKILLTDLAQIIVEWKSRKEETIILIDANDGILQKNSLLPNFLSITNLVSLIPNPSHHPATHSRGSQCIDYIFGCPRLLEHIQAAGISAFFEPPWPNTDHRGLFVDIDETGLFGATIETIPPPIRRIITSKSKKLILKLVEANRATKTIDSLLSDITTLKECSTWTHVEHDALEQIDKKFTGVLLQAETSCAIPIDFPWSPTLHQASLVYQYWTTKYHGKRNNIDTSEQLAQIQNHLPPDKVFQQNRYRSIIKQLKPPGKIS